MAIPFLNNISLNNNEIQNVKLHNTGNIPSPSAGHIYFDTDDNIAKYYDGSAWIEIVPNTNDYVDSATFAGSTITLGRTGSLSDVTVDIGSLVNDSTITITAGTALTTGGSLTTNQAANGEITIDHEDVSRTDTTSTDAPAYGGTFEAVTGVTTNAQGHVTAIDVSTVTIPASDNTSYDLATTATGTAIRLTGSDSTTDDVTISGTANEVEVSRISASELRVGLPNDITVANDLTVNNNVLISGNLEVAGTVTTVNETVKVVENNTIEFEGTTADEFEIKLTGGDPTADHTVSLPDASGTIALTSDIKDGTLTVEGGNGLTGSGTFTANDSTSPTITISHADTSSQASVDNSGLTVIQDVTLDDYGHVTGLTSSDLTNEVNTLITAKSGSIAVPTSATYTYPNSMTATSTNNVLIQLVDSNGETVYADVQRLSTTTFSVDYGVTEPTGVIALIQLIG